MIPDWRRSDIKFCFTRRVKNYENMAKTKRKRSKNTQQDFKIERL
jgi:hypothetical protein